MNKIFIYALFALFAVFASAVPLALDAEDETDEKSQIFRPIVSDLLINGTDKEKQESVEDVQLLENNAAPPPQNGYGQLQNTKAPPSLLFSETKKRAIQVVIKDYLENPNLCNVNLLSKCIDGGRWTDEEESTEVQEVQPRPKMDMVTQKLLENNAAPPIKYGYTAPPPGQLQNPVGPAPRVFSDTQKRAIRVVIKDYLENPNLCNGCIDGGRWTDEEESMEVQEVQPRPKMDMVTQLLENNAAPPIKYGYTAPPGQLQNPVGPAPLVFSDTQERAIRVVIKDYLENPNLCNVNLLSKCIDGDRWIDEEEIIEVEGLMPPLGKS